MYVKKSFEEQIVAVLEQVEVEFSLLGNFLTCMIREEDRVGDGRPKNVIISKKNSMLNHTVNFWEHH